VQIKAFATGRSVVQRSPIKSLNMNKKPPVCEANKDLTRAVESMGKRTYRDMNVHTYEWPAQG
jgi:hypothetical protein